MKRYIYIIFYKDFEIFFLYMYFFNIILIFFFNIIYQDRPVISNSNNN